MPFIDTRFVAHCRGRFTRPDAYRYLKPATQLVEEPNEDLCERAALRCDLAGMKDSLNAIRQALAESKYLVAGKYSPDQPRIPAGEPGGGRWTGGTDVPRHDPHAISNATADGRASEVQYAQNESSARYQVDLLQEESVGGHTIARHVGKDPETLKAHVRRSIEEENDPRMENIRSGSFPSVEAANRLVNSTLAQNQHMVDGVVSGMLPEQRVDAYFNSRTGYEAYSPNVRVQPYLRET